MQGITSSRPLVLMRRLAASAGADKRRRVIALCDYYVGRIGREIWPRVAPLYRPLLRRTLFIGVTGSCGKSTTKEMIGGILATSMTGRITPLNLNQPHAVARTILRTRLFDRYSVHEIGIGPRGECSIAMSLRLIRPQIGVVTNIGEDHICALGSKEAIAAEKGKLVESLPPHGIAILNADDALVTAMHARCRCRVITYGCSARATVRAVNVRSHWPDRLSFTVLHGGQSEHVQTQLLGEHWVSCALAAIASALAAGLSLTAAARALQAIPPFEGRMSPEPRDDDVVFVRDDAKAPLWTIPATLDFLAKARAARKIVVIGTLSDYSHHRPALVSVAKQASAVADHVVFIGRHAWHVLRTQSHSEGATIRAFSSFQAAHDYVDALLRPGDLVLLKGGWKDRLERLMSRRAAASPDTEGTTETPSKAAEPDAEPATLPSLVVVGLGNPGSEYEDTRHNVGQAVIDRIAEQLRVQWSQAENAWIGRGERRGIAVHLVKPITMINDTGAALRRLFHAADFSPRNCILVHDDVDLPVGSIRGRAEGGPGGHRGVRSVLTAFDDHRFRRVKIGIGRPSAGESMANHVLSRFRPDEREALERAKTLALNQVLMFLDELIGAAPAQHGAAAPSAADQAPTNRRSSQV